MNIQQYNEALDNLLNKMREIGASRTAIMNLQTLHYNGHSEQSLKQFRHHVFSWCLSSLLSEKHKDILVGYFDVFEVKC